MKVAQAFRFELAPNVAQRIALAKHVGAARFAYNWGLSRYLQAIEEKRRIPSAMELHKQWNQWKRENAPWWVEVSKCAPQEALRDLERAVRNWRRRLACRPRFKRKKQMADNTARFTGSIRVFPRHVQLPRIGKVRSKEQTEKLLVLLAKGKARILSATISREADRWFVSLTCEVERPDPAFSDGEPVGVDLGLSSFLVLSDGTRIEAPKPLRKALRLLVRRSRRLSRKQRGSKNYAKVALTVARLHRRVRNLRRDFLHRVSTWLARTKPAVVVEDLDVRSLGRGRFSRSVADVGLGTFRRMLEYKARWYGVRLLIAPRDFPSTRMCSRCGWVAPKMPLSRRMFRCPECGLVMDRDLNAALNLRLYGLAILNGSTESSSGSDACGDWLCGGTATSRSTSIRSVKQEVAGRFVSPWVVK